MKLPVLGTGYGKGDVITARNATNIWFEPRPQGEKGAVVARALPRIQETWAPTDLRLLSSLDSGQHALAINGTELVQVTISDDPLSATMTRAIANLPWTTLPVINFAEPRAAGGHGGFVVTTGHGQYVSYNGVALIHTMPDGVEAISCLYHRGYYLIASPRRLHWLTDLAGPPAALDFVGADASQDDIVELVDLGSAVAVFGQRSIQFFQVVGSLDNPLMPIIEATLSIGVAYNRQIRKIGGQVYFWGLPDGGTPGLFVLDGLSYKRVSGEDLERAIMAEPYNASNISLDGWLWHGHSIVKCHRVHNSAQTSPTILLDVSTGAITTITPDAPYSGRTWTISARGNLLVGSQRSVGVVRHQEVDPAVPRSLTTDHVVTDLLDRFTLDNLRLDCRGMGDILLEISKDGGSTWYTVGTESGANAVSDRRVQWNRLGTARQFTFRLSATGAFDVANVMLNARN